MVYLRRIILGVFVAVFGIAWIINLALALHRITDVDLGLDTLASYVSQAPASISYLVQVDLSTVTTLLFLIVAIFTTMGLERYAQIKKGRLVLNAEEKAHFPFWPTYKTLFVQLGLLGTLFAFIIAFGEAESFVDLPAQANQATAASIVAGADVSSVSASSVLLSALGTALWSTFSAIFLAFIVCPFVIEKPFQYALRNRAKGFTITGASLTALAHQGLPEEVLDGLENLEGKTYARERAFTRVLNKTLGTQHTDRYKADILRHTRGPVEPGSEVHEDIETIAQSFNVLYREVSSTQSAFHELAVEINTLGGLAKLSAMLQEFRGRLSTIELTIAALRGDVSTNQASILEGQREFRSLQTTIEALETGHESLRKGHTTTQATWRETSSDAQRHREKIESDVSKIQDRLSAVEAQHSKLSRLRDLIKQISTVAQS